jgi:hypothetical protein
MWTRKQAHGKVYVCRNRRLGSGACSAPVVPKDLLEANVLSHLELIVGDELATWLEKKSAEHQAEHEVFLAAAAREQDALSRLRDEREKMASLHRRLLVNDDAAGETVLRQLAAIDGDLGAQERRLREAEARAQEWAAEPAIDAALDYYNGLVELVRGQIARASGTAEVRAALHQAVAVIYVRASYNGFTVDIRLKDGGRAYTSVCREDGERLPTEALRRYADEWLTSTREAIHDRRRSCTSTNCARRSRCRRGPPPAAAAP